MVNKVLKSDVLLEKTNWQRKTYPLKLNLTDVQRVRLEMIFYEYKKMINKIIGTILNDFFKNHLTMLEESEWKEKKCPLCQTKKKLKYELTDFEFIKYAELKGKPIYKPIYKKGNKIEICDMCHCSHYSLRKFLLPSSKRGIPIQEWDFTKDSKIKGSSIYDSALQKAVEQIKSQEEIKKKLKYKLNFFRQRIMDNTCKLNNPEGQEFLEFLESKNKDKKEGIILLKKFIKFDEKTIEKTKRMFAEKIEYKGTAVRLYENAYELINEEGDYFIKLKDYIRDKYLIIAFYGEKYQKKLAGEFIKGKNAETEIIKKGDDFYLQYIYRKANKVPTPTKHFTAIGIDVNIINLASYVSMNKDLKKIEVKFFSGRNLRNQRKRFSKVRTIWNTKTKHKENGGKGRSKKWFKDKCDAQNEKELVKYTIHNLTTSLIQRIKDKYDKPVIVLEELKDIRTRIGKELKITKCSIEKLTKKQQSAIRGEKLLNKEVNNWNFDDFQKFLEYKANWIGIPVVYVSAKDTSIKCNKCGYIDEENYENYHEVRIKCKKCGYECNSDFNASVNIAKGFFEYLKTGQEFKKN